MVTKTFKDRKLDNRAITRLYYNVMTKTFKDKKLDNRAITRGPKVNELSLKYTGCQSFKGRTGKPLTVSARNKWHIVSLSTGDYSPNLISLFICIRTFVVNYR